MSWAERLQGAAGLATAVGAIIALVIAYRKQRQTEGKQFVEDFRTASSQLADPLPIARIAGVYAMAALADGQLRGDRKQQCIDALCGYLRLPYEPTMRGVPLSSQTREYEDAASRHITDTLVFKPSDFEVRSTIFQVVRDHLRSTQPGYSWGDYNFNLSRGTYDYIDFSEITLTKGCIDFDYAKLNHGSIVFSRARLLGGSISFYEAIIEQPLAFKSATLTAASICFEKSVFKGALLNFDGLKIAHSSDPGVNSAINFSFAHLTENTKVFFTNTQFDCGLVELDALDLVDSSILFHGANFSRGRVTFDSPIWSSGAILFRDTPLPKGAVSSNDAPFDGWISNANN